VSRIDESLWAFIGLLLTIIGTFVEAFIVLPSLENQNLTLIPHSLGIKYQIAGVLITGCLGGKNAAITAQIAYVVLGLFKLPIFAQGGGFDYFQEATFGYILGFIPGAWLCGYLAFPGKPRLESLALSAFFGLICIHLCGIVYLIGFTLITPIFGNLLAADYLQNAIIFYSLKPFFSQIILVCEISVIAFLIRLFLLY
jgi:biotin transport system substrate-specific component